MSRKFPRSIDGEFERIQNLVSRTRHRRGGVRRKSDPKTQVPKTGTWGTLPVILIFVRGKIFSRDRREGIKKSELIPGPSAYPVRYEEFSAVRLRVV